MYAETLTPEEYLKSLPEGRIEAVSKIRERLLSNLPPGFKEVINYGMLGYVVPHELYPGGYHCNPKLPLPFISLASQKGFIALYHMGLYADKNLIEWFKSEYSKYTSGRLDMGKSCIRFKNPSNIPFSLIGELASKISPEDWINIYEKEVKK